MSKDAGFVEVLIEVATWMSTHSGNPCGVNWKSWAGAFCPLCAAKSPVAYSGDGSGWVGWMHRTEGAIEGPGTFEACRAQEIQNKLHEPRKLNYKRFDC